MKLVVVFTVAAATAIYATSHRRYYASDNHRDYPNYNADPRTYSGSESVNPHSSDSSPESPAGSSSPDSSDPSSIRTVRSPSSDSHGLDYSSLNFFNFFGDSHIRTTRNADEALDDYLKHATIIAHLVNGIALQSGLMNGSIPVNDVIGELLRFGSVDVPTFAKFQKDKVTALANKLKDVQQKFDKSSEMDEDQALEWNKFIEKSPPVEKVEKLPGGEDYFKGVQKFLDDFKLELLEKPAIELESLGKKINDISKTSPSETMKNFYDEMKVLKGRFNNAETSFNEFKASATEVKKYTSLKNGPLVLQPVENMINLIEKRVTFKPFSGNSGQLVENNIDEVLSLATDSQTAQQDVSDLNTLMESRSSPDMSEGKYTDGLPNGLVDMTQLMNDVRDPWIRKIINIQGSNIIVLADGLAPLFKLQTLLSDLDVKLKPIASNSVQDSLKYFKILQESLSTLTTGSTDTLTDLFKKLQECFDIQPPISDKTIYAESVKLLQNVKVLKNLPELVVSAVAGLDPTQFSKKVDELFVSLGYSMFNNETQSLTETAEVLKKILEQDGLKDIRDFVDQNIKRFDMFKDLEKNTKNTVTGQKTFNNSRFLKNELEVHTCAQKYREKSMKASQAIRLIKTLKTLDLQKIVEVESTATTVSEVANDLANYTSITNAMKKEASEATTEINKYPDSLAKSKIIGQSVNSLRSVIALRDLKTQINQLRNIEKTVPDEIKKIPDPNAVKELVAQWSSFNTEMAQLDKLIGEIDPFRKKLNISNLTTIGDYGTPLTALVALTSVKINAKEKSKVLEFLLDPKNQLKTVNSKAKRDVKSNLEESKKTLDQLANLDLEFANHHAQFQSAPAAFGALHDFLTKLLQVPMSPKQPNAPGTQNGPAGTTSNQQTRKKEEGGGGTPWLLIIAVSCTAVALGVAGTYFFFHKSSWLKSIIVWIRLNILRDVEHAIGVHRQHVKEILQAAENHWTSTEKTVANGRKRNPNLRCNPETAVILPKSGEEENVMIYANRVTTKKGIKFIATQAPTNSTEFWMMAMQEKSDFVISMCSDAEMTSLNCSYYPQNDKVPLVSGPYSVMLKSDAPILNKKVKQRTLEITDTSNKEEKKTKTVTHLQALNWSVDNILDDHEDSLGILDLVKNSTNPIIVHCNDGGSRTMSLIGLQYIYEEVNEKPGQKFEVLMLSMCEKTWHIIGEAVYSAWLASGVRTRLITENKLKSEKPSYKTDLEVLKGMKVALVKKREDDAKAIQEALEKAEQEEQRIRDQTESAENAAVAKADKERKDNEHDELVTKVYQWIRKQYCLDIPTLYDKHSGMLKATCIGKRDIARADKEMPKRKRLSHFRCNPDTAVKFKIDGKPIVIHANHVMSHTKKRVKFIAAQGPMPKKTGFDETSEDFWGMVLFHESEYVVNLCDDEQTKKDLAKYYDPTKDGVVTCGRFTITTDSVDPVLHGKVTKRVLKVAEGTSNPTLITHYQLLTWRDDSTFLKHDTALELMGYVNKSLRPIVVHCDAGIGRTTSFIALQFVYEEILQHPENSMMEPIRKLCDQRWNAIENTTQSYWIYLGVVLRFIKEFKFDMNDYIKQWGLLIDYQTHEEKKQEQKKKKKQRDQLKPKKDKKANKNLKNQQTVEHTDEMAPGQPPQEKPKKKAKKPKSNDGNRDTAGSDVESGPIIKLCGSCGQEIVNSSDESSTSEDETSEEEMSSVEIQD